MMPCWIFSHLLLRTTKFFQTLIQALERHSQTFSVHSSQMAGSMALYSSSPPAIWSRQPSSSSFSPIEGDPSQRSSSKPATGGLSSLFSTGHSKPSPGDGLDPSCLPGFSQGMIRSRSQNDLYSLLREGGESWCGAVGIPASASGKLRECSPVSVFQGPSSNGSSVGSYRLPSSSRDITSSSCGLPPFEPNVGHSRRKHSLSYENRRPLSRREGFEIRRERSWSSFSSGALGSCIEYEQRSEQLEVIDFSETLSPDFGSISSASSPTEPSNLLTSLRRDSNSEEVVVLNCMKAYASDSSTSTSPARLPPIRSSRLCTPKSRLSLFDDILRNAQSRHDIFKDLFVVKAFREAERAHIDQYRATGDPYLVHCVETALLLAAAGASKYVVAAGLLHETLDDSSWDPTQLRISFGDDVVKLVEGVARLSELSQLARNNNSANNSLEADQLRTMFLAMVDVRVVLIKLADRLHNMRTLGALSETKQRRIASETLEIFAPLASRLGIWSWKAEMEDLCFKYLKPQEHQNLVIELSSSSREMHMMAAIKRLDLALRKAGISFHDLCGRTKNVYSIHSKMSRKGRSLKEICDVCGLRLIVSDVNSCFTALDLIHELWSCIPGKQKDYVNHPKENGYQSLHTAVMGEDGFPLEVQIRTMEMHRHAEFGMAAHWRYKEGDSKYSTYASERVEWARWVLSWHSEIMDSKLRLSPSELVLRPTCPFPFHVEGCPYSWSPGGLPERNEDPLFVILVEDETMLVQELPCGSTPRDLLRRLIPPKGFFDDLSLSFWKQPKLLINHKVADSLEQKLVMGDVIEVMPSITAESLDTCREKIKRMYGYIASHTDSRGDTSGLVRSSVASLLT